MGRYEVLFRIAAGGMAEVYAARVMGEAGFQKLVAVKRMLPTLTDDEEFVTMFLDEARVAANISSPHVVQTLDLGRDGDGALYIAMELVVGVTLSRILKEAAKVRRAVPVAISVELLAQSALGLHAAHEAATPIGEPLEIVHRDVSPQNILVGIDGRARITDFGVARALLRTTKTDAGRIKGKFAYCSPEQLRSENVDRRADVFALGVVAWEALAGQRLFVAEHPLATMERVQNMPILPVNQVRSRVPREIAEVIEKALQRDPDARFATAAEFAHELRAAATRSGTQLPTQAEVSKFVKAAGGEPLQKMRGNIRAALAEEGREPSEPFSIEEPAELASASGTRDTDVNNPRNEGTVQEPDSSGVARLPGNLIQTPAAAVAPRGRNPWLSGFAILAAVLLGVGGALAVQRLMREDTPPIANPVEPPPPTQTHVAPEEVPIPEPTAEVDSEADPELAAPPEAIDPSPRVTMRGRGMRGMRTMRSAAIPDPAPMVTVMEPAMEAVRMDPPPRMDPEVAMQPTMMRGPLVGLDAFDRQVGD